MRSTQAAGQRPPHYDDDYAYKPPAPPSAAHSKVSARGDTKEQYEMRTVDSQGLGSTEAFFSEVPEIRVTPALPLCY